MKFCYRCGAKIQPGSRFCVECGTALVENKPAPAPVAPAPAPIVPVPVVSVPDPKEQPEAVKEEQSTVMYEAPVEEKPAPVVSEQETIVVPDPEPVPVFVPVQEPVVEEKRDPDATVFVAPVIEPEFVPAPAPVEPVAKPVSVDPDATVFVAEEKAPVAEPQPVPVQQPVAAPQQPVFPQQPAAPQQKPAAPQPTAFPQQKPAPQPQKPAAPQAPAGKKSSKAKKYEPLGGGRKFLAVILCILIFFMSSTAVSMVSARLAIRPESIADTMQGLVSSVELSEIPAIDIVPEAEEDMSMSDWIAEQIEVYYSGYVKVDSDDVEEYLEKSVLLHSISEIFGNFVEDLLTGSHHSVPDEDDIREILIEDQELVEELFGVAMDEEDIETLAAAIAESGAMEELDADVVREEAPAVFEVVELSFSWWVIGGVCLLVLIFCVLVGLVNRGNMIRTFRDLGVTETVLGSIMTVFVLACYLLTDYLVSMVGIEALGDMVRYALLKSGIPAVCVLGAGILMLVLSAILKAIHKKSEAKKVKAVA